MKSLDAKIHASQPEGIRRDCMHFDVLLMACMGLCSYYTSLRVAEYSAAQGEEGVCPESTRTQAKKIRRLPSRSSVSDSPSRWRTMENE